MKLSVSQLLGPRTSNSSAALPEGSSATRVSARDLIGLRHAGEALKLEKTKIRAQQAGTYLSAAKGRGMEFDESRPYQPGDDIRSLDWRVTARTGKPHTKLFREERERPVLLWVDYRTPMFFATRGVFKSVLAARTAALLAWSSAHQGDRIGGLVFSDSGHRELRPRRGRGAVLRLIHELAALGKPDDGDQTLARVTAAATQNAAHALGRLRRVARPGSLVFLMSDFRNLGERAESHLLLLAKHNSLVMVFISDPLEEHLPPAGRYRVSDGNRTIDLDTGNKGLGLAYREHFLNRRRDLETLCRRNGMFFLPCSTHQDIVKRLHLAFTPRPV
jgi:uncharacterized protein (DUF58 family)